MIRLSPVSIVPLTFHMHLFVYRRRYKMLAIYSAVKWHNTSSSNSNSSSSSSSIQMDVFSRGMLNPISSQVKYACLQRDLTDVAKTWQAYSGALGVGPTVW